MKRIIALIVSLFLIITAYSQDGSAIFDYGSIENNIYTNSYFKLKITIPPTWLIHSKSFADSLTTKEINKLNKKNPDLKNTFKAGEIKNAMLLMTNKYRVGAAVEFNPGLAITAENLMKFPEIETGEDYLKQVKKLMSTNMPNYELGKKISKVIIDGIPFYKFDVIQQGTTEIRQTYYSSIIKGFGLGLITTYNTNKQEKELLKIINTINFSK